MFEMKVILIAIVGVMVIVFAFLFSAIIRGIKEGIREEKNKIKSTQPIEEKHIAAIKIRSRYYKWQVVLPVFLLLLTCSIIILATNSKNPNENFFIMIAQITLKIISLVIWVSASIIFLTTLVKFFSNARYHRGQLLRKMHKAYRIRQRCSARGSRYSFNKILLILALLSLLASFFSHSNFLLSVSALLGTLILFEAYEFVEPPVILILAKSQDQALVLQDYISEKILGSTISLIKEDKSVDFKWAKASGNDVLRALPGEDWKRIILDFTEIVKIIVLDCREITDNVEIEISLLTRPELAARTLLVYDNNQSKETNDNRYKNLIQAGAKLVTPLEIEAFLFNIFKW